MPPDGDGRSLTGKRLTGYLSTALSDLDEVEARVEAALKACDFRRADLLQITRATDTYPEDVLADQIRGILRGETDPPRNADGGRK